VEVTISVSSTWMLSSGMIWQICSVFPKFIFIFSEYLLCVRLCWILDMEGGVCVCMRVCTCAHTYMHRMTRMTEEGQGSANNNFEIMENTSNTHREYHLSFILAVQEQISFFLIETCTYFHQIFYLQLFTSKTIGLYLFYIF
jgi:hypothetical protein